MSINGKLPTKPSSTLQGRRVLVTRAADQAAEFVALLQHAGARVVECPTIELVAPQQWDELDAALAKLADFDWLVLTSVNGVRFFFTRLREQKRGLLGIKICAVGPKTAAALSELGVIPDLLPEQFTGEGVIAAFQDIDLQGKRVLFPKADGARELIPQQLTKMGAQVVDPVVYCNIVPRRLPEPARRALEQHQLDAAVFSSPSTVRNLAQLAGGIDTLKQWLDGVVIASIGPVTTRACLELGLEVAVEPTQATLDNLITSLQQHFANLPKKKPRR